MPRGWPVHKGRVLSTEQTSVRATPAATAADDGSLWSILLCYGGMIAIAIAVNLPPIYLTTFSQTFGGENGLDDWHLGLIGTILFVGLVAGLLIAGPLADRLGARLFVVLGSALIAGGLGLMSIAPNYALLLFATCFMGVGAGVLDMILSPIVAALKPHNRTSAMNWLHAFYAIGTILITLFCAQMIRLSVQGLALGTLHLPASLFGWRNVCLAVIVVPVVVLAGFTWAMVPPLVSENKERTSSLVLLRSATFLVTLVAMLLAGATELGMAQWLPAYAEKALGYPKWTASQALTGFAIAMAIGRLGGGVITRHIRPARLLLASCGLAAVLYLVSAYCPWRAVALAACVMIGLAISGLWPTMLGATADRFPHGGATMFGMLAAFGNAGGTINMAIGSIAQRADLHTAIASVAICPAAMMIILVWLGLHTRDERRGLRSRVPVQ